jgi:hypothetical protein
VRHLLVLLPVPAVYPKIPVTESVIAGISGAGGGKVHGVVRAFGSCAPLRRCRRLRARACERRKASEETGPTRPHGPSTLPAGALARSSEMRAALRKANLPGGAVNMFMEADLLDDLK